MSCKGARAGLLAVAILAAAAAAAAQSPADVFNSDVLHDVQLLRYLFAEIGRRERVAKLVRPLMLIFANTVAGGEPEIQFAAAFGHEKDVALRFRRSGGNSPARRH